MNKSLIALTVAVASLTSVSAFADDADPAGQFAQAVTSQRSRAEVNAEAVAGVARGAFRPSNPHASINVQPVLNSGTTRAQVVAEFLADREEAAAMTAEDSGSAYLTKFANVRPANQYLAGR
jgi:hypothetical protein